jgi:hypothetical protein
MRTGLSALPARPATIEPTAVEPVKLILRTKGLEIKAGVISAPS